ncbi:ABC transporter permease [Microbacterium sp. No. 7]|uniref:ABC transporter permease n=1 Tax=Microbacterium sp. No. 7 TaxID=1714373 RepID=UPI0006D12F4A|nr:ABC transporter permease [Microbacterium sp. No. 7]ALJ21321.1 ABC transporter [Microbacterium sp. No. 7]
MNAVRLGVHRAGYEIRGYFRSPDQVFFTFLFPVLMLSLFATIFSEVGPGGDAGLPAVSAGQYYLPGMIAAGLLLSGVQNLAIDIAMERSDGTLKRLGGTPLPAVSYFIGKFAQVAVTGTLQVGLLLVVSVLAFDVELPADGERWLVFAWVFVLGLATSALLGIALSAVPRSGRSASAVVIPIVLVLQFVSGVYLAFFLLPEWLQNAASAFPLKWMAQGMRSVFLPDGYRVMEQGGEWNLAGVAIALGVWLVVGLVLARLTFRWTRRDA